MMRLTVSPFVFAAVLGLAGCGQKPAHEFPHSARVQFEQTCPAGEAVCECTWDELTRLLTYEEYQAALERYRTEGLMDPRVTRARTHCLEHSRS